MLIDFLTDCSSIIKVTSYSTLNSNMIINQYSLKTKNDILSWSLSDDTVTSICFDILSTETKHLKSITYDIEGSTNSSNIGIKIETSLDYINWTELKFKGYNQDDKYLYTNCSVSGEYWNFVTNKFDTLTDNDITNLVYKFTKFNNYSKLTEYLYNNLEWKFIRFTFTNIQGTSNNPLKFKSLNVYIDENFISQITNILELKSEIFFKSKMFDDYEFIPDMLTNYLKMIEESNIEANNINYVYTSLNADITVGSPLEGIGNDFIGVDTVIY